MIVDNYMVGKRARSHTRPTQLNCSYVKCVILTHLTIGILVVGPVIQSVEERIE